MLLFAFGWLSELRDLPLTSSFCVFSTNPLITTTIPEVGPVNVSNQDQDQDQDQSESREGTETDLIHCGLLVGFWFSFSYTMQRITKQIVPMPVFYPFTVVWSGHSFVFLEIYIRWLIKYCMLVWYSVNTDRLIHNMPKKCANSLKNIYTLITEFGWSVHYTNKNHNIWHKSTWQHTCIALLQKSECIQCDIRSQWKWSCLFSTTTSIHTKEEGNIQTLKPWKLAHLLNLL